MKRFLTAILYVVMAVICFIPMKTADAAVLDNAKQYNGHYYKLFDASLAWTEAAIYCQSTGGHLVTITSAEEQRFVESLIMPGRKNLYWIGARRDGDNFIWIDTNKPLSHMYTHWEPGEPNNNGGNQFVVAMFRGQPSNANYLCFGFWLDLANEAVNSGFYGLSNIGFICEWDSAVSAHESKF